METASIESSMPPSKQAVKKSLGIPALAGATNVSAVSSTMVQVRAAETLKYQHSGSNVSI
jgi:hypothetical protein